MIELRPYQVRCVNLTHAAMKEHRKVMLVAPTGSGKRMLMVWWCLKGAEKGRRVLFVTDRQILVKQMSDECRKHHLPYGIIMGSEPRNDDALVQIASIQTLQTREWRDNPGANLILVDEAHKAGSSYAALFNRYTDAKVVGCTATPVGAQGRALTPSLFDVMVEGVKNSELLRDGYLLPTRCWYVSEPNLKGVSINDGCEYNANELAARVKEGLVYADVFKWWGAYTHMQTIVFAPLVSFAYGVRDQFRERGFTAEVIEAGTKKHDRTDCFERFENRELRVLVSVDVLREGFDAPIAQCGIDLQPNNQLRTYWQKVGRIRRKYPGQEQAVWLDFAGNYYKFPHPDSDPPWDQVTEAESISELLAKPRNEPKPWSCKQCGYTLAPWEKLHGDKCPNCGRDLSTKGSVRRIRMLDGTMKTESVEKKVKQVVTDAQKLWDRCRYIAFHSDGTLNFARVLYRKEMIRATGRPQWPPRGLKNCPDSPSSGDWKRKVSQVYPWMGKK